MEVPHNRADEIIRLIDKCLAEEDIILDGLRKIAQIEEQMILKAKPPV